MVPAIVTSTLVWGLVSSLLLTPPPKWGPHWRGQTAWSH